MKNLEMYGVQEMDAKEMREVKGGGFFGALLGFVVGAVASLFIDSACVTDEKGITKCANDGESKMMICGLIGASFGAALPF